jgi:hypothetical protein
VRVTGFTGGYFVAWDRQEGDAIGRDLGRCLFSGQEFEAAAVFAVDRRRAIIGPATELPTIADCRARREQDLAPVPKPG